jgi:acyl-CoA reductase-like NAD-dependent aldehyde dehydrogenase
MNDAATMTINGAGVTASSACDVINPALAEPFTRVPDCSAEQLDQAG